MKKLTLFLLIALLLISCGYAPIDNTTPVIVTCIEKDINTSCDYYGEGNRFLNFAVTSCKFKFRDSCGKYQIGDTIKFN